MKIALFILASIGLFASLVVHLCSLAHIDVQAHFPSAWALHIGIFVVFIPAVEQLKKDKRDPSLSELTQDFPKWVIRVGAALMVYVVINFFVALAPLSEGAPAERNGQFVLEQKGNFVRNITEAEFHELRASELRGFSGHWLIFYFVPFAHFALRRKPITSRLGSTCSQRSNIDDA